MASDDHIGPFGREALTYWEAGWRGVLPLPAGRKWPPPPGWTGHDGAYPSRADLQAWLDGGEAAGNIALRLPPGVIGLDVDAYGGKLGGATLARLESELGPLPETWRSTARVGDAVSGIRLFRLPELSGPVIWPGEAGANIEIIQAGHRYAVVWPSTNPDADGARYEWIRPGGAGRSQVMSPVPRVDWLSELPARWFGALAHEGERRVGVELDDPSARAWLGSCRVGEACAIVARTCTDACRALAGGGQGARHETARDAVHALARLGGEGHAGVWDALGELRARFLDSIEGERGRDGPGEWRRLLMGAVRLAAGSDARPRQGCDCATWAGEGLGFDPGFPGDGGAGDEGGAASEASDDEVSAVERLEGALLTAAQVAELPAPTPLVAGLLDLDTLAWLIGKPGSFKSFVALTLAGHVGRGLPWAGRAVREGDVLYVMAEGVGGASMRVRAWEKHHGAMTGVSFMPHAIQVRGDWWAPLVELVARRRPVLVVVDTQARVTAGFRENDNSDMGDFIIALDRLRRAAGSCVLVLHHIGRGGDDARGASAIDGAQDTELKVSRLGGEKSLHAVLEIDKQKDGADTAQIILEMVRVDMGADEATGREVSSLVAMPPAFATPARKPWRDDLPINQQRIVDVLGEHKGILGGTYADVRALVVERFGPMPKTSYSTAFTRLCEMGVIVRIEGTQRYALASLLTGRIESDPDIAGIVSKIATGMS